MFCTAGVQHAMSGHRCSMCEKLETQNRQDLESGVLQGGLFMCSCERVRYGVLYNIKQGRALVGRSHRY